MLQGSDELGGVIKRLAAVRTLQCGTCYQIGGHNPGPKKLNPEMVDLVLAVLTRETTPQSQVISRICRRLVPHDMTIWIYLYVAPTRELFSTKTCFDVSSTARRTMLLTQETIQLVEWMNGRHSKGRGPVGRQKERQEVGNPVVCSRESEVRQPGESSA